MAAATQTSVFLGEFETKSVLDLETRAPGTYYVKMMVRCNSLLSSVFIQTADGGATIKVNYFDTTTGSEDTPERYDLNGHDILGPANAGETNRLLVTKIHNKPVLEVIVAGGSATFGVYVTAVTSSASDIDSALIRDGDPFIPSTSKAIPMACYNEDTGTMQFIRCPMPVTIISDTTEGAHYHIRGSLPAIPGSPITLITDTVPGGTLRRLHKLWVTAYNDGYFSLKVNGLEIATGLISNVQHNISFNFEPHYPISAGGVIELKYFSDDEPNYPCLVTAFLSGDDIT